MSLIVKIVHSPVNSMDQERFPFLGKAYCTISKEHFFPLCHFLKLQALATAEQDARVGGLWGSRTIWFRKVTLMFLRLFMFHATLVELTKEACCAQRSNAGQDRKFSCVLEIEKKLLVQMGCDWFLLTSVMKTQLWAREGSGSLRKSALRELSLSLGFC